MVVKELASKLCVPVLGLFDYNAGGVLIWLTYTLGSVSTVESHSLGVPVCWLGLHGEQVEKVPQHVKVPMTSLELRKLDRVLESEFIQVK